MVDAFLESLGLNNVDYVHGTDEALKIAAMPGNAAFIFEPMDKGTLFDILIKTGILPKKAFSMGEAREKRYYLESRRLK